MEAPTTSTLPSDSEIEQAARDMREAIDAAGQAPWAQKHITFPYGSCGHATELLGRYLIDRFGIAPDYVCQDAVGNMGGWEGGHAWLEWNGLTIDISGDQFGWLPVIVTRTPEFHGKGSDQTRHPVCLPHQLSWWVGECGPLWSAILPFLPPESAA